MSQPGVLQLDGLCCEVEKFTVFRDLNLSFQPGAIHGVLGQNGAGKTTLLNLLAGVSRPSGGGIFLDGRPLRFRSPHDAVAAGIRMSAQEETLIPDLSVAENMLFGQYGCGKAGILKHRKLEREMQELLDRLGIPLRAQTPVAKLDYGSRQMLKIACLLAGRPQARILLMDEPYRACPAQDLEHLYDIMRMLRDQGLTIIFSTHRVADALRVCDMLTLIRGDGSCEQIPAHSVGFEEAVSRISGRAFRSVCYPRLSARPGKELLRMEGVCTRRIENVSLHLNRGEILGIAGLLGSGRTGVARALCGLDPLSSGVIRVNHKELRRDVASRSGLIGALLCNRRELLLPDMDLSENITVSALNMVSSSLMLNTSAERKVGFDYCRQFNIDMRHFDDPARVLSVGNQQKLLLARLFFSNCRILVLDEPTMNIDLISKNDLYNLMNSYICRGNSIILISSDLEELRGMTHRIIVMKDRSVLQEIRPEALNYESLICVR